MDDVRSDRRFAFPVAPDGLWAALGRVDCYRDWWPWLRRFDAVALREGERWECVVQPPLPYRVAFVLSIDAIDVDRSVVASVDGDVVGQARLQITPSVVNGSPGSELRLVSRLAPRSPLLRGVATLAPGVARFGHDWVIDRGVHQFAAHLSATRPSAGQPVRVAPR